MSDWRKIAKEFGAELMDCVGYVQRMAEEIARLRAELKIQDDANEILTRERDDLALTALAELSRFTATPAAGYVAEPFILPGDINRLGRERDEARASAARMRAALERSRCTCAEDFKHRHKFIPAGVAIQDIECARCKALSSAPSDDLACACGRRSDSSNWLKGRADRAA